MSYIRNSIADLCASQNPVTGAQQAGSWAVRETFVAIVTTNIPMIFPLLRRWLTPIFGSISSTLSRGTNNKYDKPNRSDLPAPGSIMLGSVTEGSSNKKKNRPPYTQYPITEITVSGSEEHLNKSPPLPGGISKNVEIHIKESKRASDRGTSSTDSNIEGRDAYFTVEVNGIERPKATRSKSYRESMRSTFSAGGNRKDDGIV